MSELFVYGSLQFPVVLEIILGYIPSLQIVEAPGWKACQLRGVPYPGLVADPTATATGILLSGLDDLSLTILDDFEGTQYRREHIGIRTVDEEEFSVNAYILADDSALPEIWTKNYLSGEIMEKFLEYCREWRAGYSHATRSA